MINLETILYYWVTVFGEITLKSSFLEVINDCLLCRFRTNRVSAEVILKLREKFDELLQKKAINPGPVDPESEDALLLG